MNVKMSSDEKTVTVKNSIESWYQATSGQTLPHLTPPIGMITNFG